MGFGRGLGRWRARFAAPALSRILLLAREALMRRGTCRARGLLTSYVLSLTVNILSYLIGPTDLSLHNLADVVKFVAVLF